MAMVDRRLDLNGHRVLVSLEPEMWEALDQICGDRACSVEDYVAVIGCRCGGDHLFLARALRLSIIRHFRQAAAARGLCESPGCRDLAAEEVWWPGMVTDIGRA